MAVVRKNGKKTIITLIVLLAIFFMMSMTVLADEYLNVRISLAANQVWTGGYSVTRSGRYSYVSAGLDTVFPSEGNDNFERIQVRVTQFRYGFDALNEEGVVTLKEGSGYQNLTIKEGYLNCTTVYFQFRGNSNKAAEAIVNYKSN